MKKVFVFAAAAALTLSSCVSKKKYVELEEMQKATSDKLSNTKKWNWLQLLQRRMHKQLN